MRIGNVALVLPVFLCLLNIKIYGQNPIMDNAFGGKNGIFVYFDKDIPVKGSSSNWFVYKIERRIKDGNNWQTLDTINSPSTFEEFKSKVNAIHSLLPYLTIGDENVLKEIWSISQKYKVIDSLYSYAQVPVYGIALGTIYLDTNAKKNTEYEYRYSKIDNTGKTLKTIRTLAVEYPGEVTFKKIREKEFRSDNEKIFIKWTTESKKMPVFQVMREDNLRQPFRIINPVKGINAGNDHLNIFLQDTLINSESIYRYYIIPEDIFGNKGENSDTVIVGNYNFREAASLPDSIRTNNASEDGGIRLTWIPKIDPSIKYIDIYKSQNYDTGYVHITSIPATQSSFLDQEVKPQITYYYYFQAESPLGEKSTKSPRYFGVYTDPDIPFPPVDLKGEAVKNGVKLQWTKNEKFIRGYYVYRNNSVDGKLVQVSHLIPVKDSIITFVDLDSTLSGKTTYGYAIKTENTSYVKSSFSDTVYVRPSISTKPLTPTNLKLDITDTVVNLYWDNMSALQDGIDGYDLNKREVDKNGKPVGELIAVNDSTIPPWQNHYSDNKVERGKSYLYTVQSKDIFGSKSNFSNAVIAGINNLSIIPPAGLTAKKLADNILITWNGAEDKNISGYKIYRYERGQTPLLLKNIKDVNKFSYEDKSAKRNHLYFYYVTSYSFKGNESEPSLEVGIRF
jgi:fibronectin type 3 domain-containing protein